MRNRSDGGPADSSRDVPEPGAKPAMIRSEEELVATTLVRGVRRLRLRKRVMTEDVTVTVTLRKEVMELEEEPMIQADAVDIAIGSDPAGDIEMVLFEEEFVVEKRIVPKERVRLVKTVVVTEETFTDNLKRERIEVEGDVIRPDTE